MILTNAFNMRRFKLSNFLNPLALVLLLISSGCATSRMPASSPTNNQLLHFCKYPSQFICAGTTLKGREILIEEFAEPHKQAALKNAASAIRWEGPHEMTINDIRAIKSQRVPRDSRRKKGFEVYYSTLYRGLYAKASEALGSGEQLLESFKFSKIQNYLRLGIKERIQDRIVAEKMLRILEQVELVDVNSVLNLKNSLVDQRLRDNYYDACGHDGLDDNAFAFEWQVGPRKGVRRVVVLCAGAIVASMMAAEEPSGRSLPIWVTLLMTIGHEIGHHFDAQNSELRGAYNQVLNCVKQQSGNSFKSHQSNLPAEKIFYDHVGEITADSWGAEAVAQYLKEYRRLSNLEIGSILKISMADLCAGEDDGVHPSGEFRMDYIRDHTSLFDLLECSSIQTKFGCSL